MSEQAFNDIANHMKKMLSLFAWFLCVGLIGFSIGLLTKSEIPQWYRMLQRPALTPPDTVFPVAWGILYPMIAATGWLIWERGLSTQIKALYVIQLLLNYSWSLIFFKCHFIFGGLVVLLLLNGSVIFLIKACSQKQPVLVWLNIPYLLWLFFALYLNYAIWVLNPL